MDEQHEFSPEDSEGEPATPAVDVLEGVVGREAEARVGCYDKGDEEDE